MKCQQCGSVGFTPSAHGCHFCDGTEGGNPPQGSVDMLQLEMRVVAAYAHQDTQQDPHREKAAQILGKRVEEVTPEERLVGKAANFPLMYAALRDIKTILGG